MTEIDKLAWLLIVDKKVLFARSKGKNIFYTSGGKREKNETDQAALIREIKEEISVDLIPETIRYVKTFTAQAHGKPEGVFVKIACYSADFIGELKPNAEIEELAWLNHKDSDRYSLVAKIIMDWLLLEGMIE
jgi:8-oxo-dGTP diphosphatase